MFGVVVSDGEIGLDELGDDVGGGDAFGKQLEALGAEGGVDDGLGGDGTDAGFGVADVTGDGEAFGGDGDAGVTGLDVESADGEGVGSDLVVDHWRIPSVVVMLWWIFYSSSAIPYNSSCFVRRQVCGGNF